MTNTSPASQQQLPAWLLYLALLILLLLILAGGYLIFRIFVLQVMPDLNAYNLLALAVIAGVASFFSPCAFPLLPGYLSLVYSHSEQLAQTRSSRWSGLAPGLAAAAGVVSFNLILGMMIGLLGAGVAQGLAITGSTPTFTRWFRGALGVVLVLLGIAQLREVNLKPLFADALAWRTRPRRSEASQRPLRSLYFYGLGYNAAGMGCTAPILAGLVIFGFSSGGLLAALSAFGVFAVTMGGLMLLISLLVSASQDTLIQRLKVAAPRIKTASGLLLIVVGLFNILTSLDVTSFVQLLFP